MKTEKMLKVMQAFIGGQEIQITECFEGEVFKDGWEDCKYPKWNWEFYSYRVKPKTQQTFKAGDKVIEKRLQNLPLVGNEILEVKNFPDDSQKIIIGDKIFALEEAKNLFVREDNCLWYWEFFNNGTYNLLISGNTTNFGIIRLTREQAEQTITSMPLKPLWGLGFALA
ncbi:hypothetical protein [Campylobacter sp. RM16188]|uniref:hypothetical protein n=1 Tax=Campylobacter sp. RM16188 TaxID=1705725 RepID=UPI0015539B77|nr:hypothetical protein [Campylobacter sp. RM16188]